MKLLLVGDMHLRATAPKRRTDDFFETQMDKLDQILEIAFENDCGAIIQAGDFFDSPKQVNRVLTRCITAIRSRGIPWYAVYGQHDLYMRSYEDKGKTALGVLEATKLVQILNAMPTYRSTGLKFKGKSWGEPIPKPAESNCFNVLVAHEQVGPEKLWQEQDLTTPEEYGKLAIGYDLVVLGDYHYSFVKEVDGTIVCNPGVMVRLTASTRDILHKPQVFVYDLQQGSIEAVRLSVAPSEEVFDLEGVGVEDNKMLETWAQKLRQGAVLGTGFSENLFQACDENKVSQPVRDELNAALEASRE